MAKAVGGLPDFMAGHLLVAFHRGDDAKLNAAIHMLDAEQRALQDRVIRNDDSDYPSGDVVAVLAPEQADGVTSIDLEKSDVDETWHRPVLDLDMDAALIPSATPGHHHLYIDKLIPHEDYVSLLIALEKCGLIEQGYMAASTERGYSSARLPSKPKEI